MTDLAKVIKGLECCILRDPDDHARCSKCPYESNCVNRLKTDALSMLKAQEPVKAIADGEDSYMCNNCGTVIGWAEWEPGGIEEVKYKFCPECGRAVKWDD